MLCTVAAELASGESLRVVLPSCNYPDSEDF